MPSPIAHLGAGYVLYQLSEPYAPDSARRLVGPVSTGLIIALSFSMAPDIDSVAGVLTGQFSRFHNNLTHSFVIAALVSLGFGIFMRWRMGKGFRYWWGLAFVTYGMHIVMDSAAVSRGVMAFWPFSSERYLFPVTIFYGFHWSDGIFSTKHLITLVTELGFVAVIVLLSRIVKQRFKAVKA